VINSFFHSPNLTPQWRQKFGTAETSGVVVVGVEQGSLADESGIQPGDVIKEVNRKSVRNLSDYNAALSGSGRGQPALLLLKRGKQTFFVTMEGR